jgi:hypothetical protein
VRLRADSRLVFFGWLPLVALGLPVDFWIEAAKPIHALSSAAAGARVIQVGAKFSSGFQEK